MQLCTITSLPLGMNETMYYLNKHMYYLEISEKFEIIIGVLTLFNVSTKFKNLVSRPP